MENNYCVYIHTTPNNKKYVGITKFQDNLQRRWQNGLGYKHNEYFNRAIKKYGWNNINHEIIERDLTLYQACKIEIELIKKYNTTNINNGYNISTGGDNASNGIIRKPHSKEWRENHSNKLKGHISTQETNAKISKALKGKKKSEEHTKKIIESHKKQQKPILALDKNYNIVKEFDGIRMASREVGANQSNIQKCLKDITKSAKGYHWKYKEQ